MNHSPEMSLLVGPAIHPRISLRTSMANSSEPSFQSCSATGARDPQVSGNGCHDGAMALTRWGDATGDEAAARLGDPREGGGPGALAKDGSIVSGGLQGCRQEGLGHHFFMYRYKNIVFRIFTFRTFPQLFGLVNVYPHYLTVYVCMYV